MLNRAPRRPLAGRLIPALSSALLLGALASPAGAAPGPRPAPRAVPARPVLYVTVERTADTHGAAGDLLRALGEALPRALAAEPRCVTRVEHRPATPAGLRLELLRRRLAPVALEVQILEASHVVRTVADGKVLEAVVKVGLKGRRLDRPAAAPAAFDVTGSGTVRTPIAVVLRAEVHASRLAALDAALAEGLAAAIQAFLAPPPRRPR